METSSMPHPMMQNMWNGVFLTEGEQPLILTVISQKTILDGWLHLPCGNKFFRSLINHLSKQENCNPSPTDTGSRTKGHFYVMGRANKWYPHRKYYVERGVLYSKLEATWSTGTFSPNAQIYQQNSFRLLSDEKFTREKFNSVLPDYDLKHTSPYLLLLQIHLQRNGNVLKRNQEISNKRGRL